MQIFTLFKTGQFIKTLVVMKIISLLIILICFKVSGSVYAQNITLNEQEAPLTKVFRQIELQSGYTFMYNDALMANAQKVTITAKNTPLNQVLAQCFAGQALAYDIVDKTIIIKHKEKSLMERIVDFIKPIKITGIVTDEKGGPMPDVSVRIKGTEKLVRTDLDGKFTIEVPDENAVLQFSFIGYQNYEVTADKTNLNIRLKEGSGELGTVDIVNTGYQEISKERSTGSFSIIEKKTYDRAVSTNFLDRLRGVGPGLVFDRNTGNDAGISIRGQSTIFANTQPLIILDNFPYEGDLSNINPNDIESVTLLKDAAAASIWGARAGNGVIVLKSKTGHFNQPVKVIVNSNITIGEKPDLFYAPRISSSSYAEMEKTLFGKGFYDDRIDSYNKLPLTPVVEVLLKQRNGELSESQANTEIDNLSKYDLRNDAEKYLYRKSVSQQYNFNLSGGSTSQRYFLSLGYDRVLNNVIGNNNDRFTINTNNTYSLLNNKLEVSTGLWLTQRKDVQNGISYEQLHYGNSTVVYPYARLADPGGKPLSIARYRQGYVDTVGNGALLDWNYRPSDEVKNANNKIDNTNYLLNLDVKYKLLKGLDVIARYQYGRSTSLTNNLYSDQTYYTRDYINKFSSIDETTGQVSRPVPLGGILDLGSSYAKTQNFRTQLNYSSGWNGKHNLTGLAGFEIKGVNTHAYSNRLYGYDEAHATNGTVDYVSQYPNFITGSGSQIESNQNTYEYNDRYVSFFGNAAYTYNDKYIFSVSGRRDASNIFGVSTNQKWSPFWSAGVSWDLSKESFYHFELLPYLRIRATYGYNGNVDKSVSAYLTTLVNENNIYGKPTVVIKNPPNANLRWERNAIWNIAVDFSTKINSISGSFEYFTRKGTDLMGVAILAPTSGLSEYKGNTADMKGNGFDLTLNSNNLNERIKWNTTLLLSLAKNKVTGYRREATNIGDYINNNSFFIGNPVTSVYAYKWAGLNPETGAPRGYLNNEASEDYSSIISSTNNDDLVYKGSAFPQTTLSLLNTFSFRNFSISFNIIGKFDYVFRHPSINYGNLYTGSDRGHSDYELRWQKAGDESKTNVPALYYPYDSNRDIFYTQSEVLVEKGDHIRLQDIRLSYDRWPVKINGKKVANLNLYLYANNLGVIWKATELDLNPDYPNSTYVTPRTIAIGCKIDF